MRLKKAIGLSETYRLVRSGNVLIPFRNRLRSVQGKPRLLLRRPLEDEQRTTSRRINSLLDLYSGDNQYLEIGVSEGRTLERISCSKCVGVDPEPSFDRKRLPGRISFFEMTSDQFFDRPVSDEFYSVILIDGLHTAEQTYRDLLNALQRLAPGGAILLDDTVPCDAVSAIPDKAISLQRRRLSDLVGSPWHGDVWKVVVALSDFRTWIEWRTIIGSGNPQTLVWRRRRMGEPPSLYRTLPTEILELEFEQIFVDGVPPSVFNTTTEREAIADWKRTSER